MRIPLIVLGVTTLLCILLRDHIRDLLDVGRTYSTFYPFLRQYPGTLYCYDPSNTTSPREDAVPRHLHQILLTEGGRASHGKYAVAMDSCRNIHPGWNYTLWEDDTAVHFMRDNYPAILPHYLGYPQRIQRANILRYALLHHFGGVYLDIDVTCLTPLDPLLNLHWLTPGAHPAGVNNAFILSIPYHPFLQHLLDAVPSRDIKWGLPYVENMLSTGCMFFSNRWMSYVRTQQDERLSILADERGDMAPHMLRGVVTTPLVKAWRSEYLA